MASSLDGQPCEGGVHVYSFHTSSPAHRNWHIVGTVEIFVEQINK